MRRRRGGNMVMESMLFLPIILLLLVGMVRIAEITYLYYTLKKTLYAAAMYLAAQQGANFCSPSGDPSTDPVLAAKNYATTGTTDASATPFLPALTPDMLDIQPECYDPSSQTVGTCDTTACGTDGVIQPDFIVVTIPNGYSINTRFPYILSQSIPLVPYVRVPFGGT